MKKSLLMLLLVAVNLCNAQFQPINQKNKANGYAGLNSQGKIDANRLPTLPVPTWNSISNKPSTFPGDWNTLVNKPSEFPSTWNSISNKPSTFISIYNEGSSSSHKRVMVMNKRTNKYMFVQGLTRSFSASPSFPDNDGINWVTDDSSFRNNTGSYSAIANIAIGDAIALKAATGGRQFNVIIGETACQDIANFSFNTALGPQAARHRVTGDNNIFLGYYAGAVSGTGSNNVILGAGASSNNSNLGSSCIVIGTDRGNNLNGSNQLDIGGWIMGNGGKINIGSSAIPASSTSAVLQLSGTAGGFLPNRLTAAQATAIANKEEGLLVYVTTTDATFITKGWYGWNGAAWEKLNN